MAFSAAFNGDNLTPFAPEGADGVVSAAAIIFFAYIGFDAVSTGAEEAKNPKRDLPLAIVGSLVICTVIYILVAIAAVGSLRRDELAESDAPLAAVLDEGAGISWAASLLAFGALIAITSVLVTIFYGQTRIFFAMARDGLLPRGIAKVNPRTGTPVRLTIGMGIAIAAAGRGRAAERDRQAGQHRHAVRVLPGEHRRDHPAPHAAGHGAPVPRPVRARCSRSSAAADHLPGDRRCRARRGSGSWSGWPSASLIYFFYGRHHSRAAAAPASER